MTRILSSAALFISLAAGQAGAFQSVQRPPQLLLCTGTALKLSGVPPQDDGYYGGPPPPPNQQQPGYNANANDPYYGQQQQGGYPGQQQPQQEPPAQPGYGQNMDPYGNPAYNAPPSQQQQNPNYNDPYGATPPPAQQQPQQGEEPKLILDGIDQHMAQFKSKYPTAEADYLAAARKRAEARMESVNNMSTDQDWYQVADEKKKQMGGALKDDWEASAKEAGNEDSQILIPVDISASGEGDDEPKLLL